MPITILTEGLAPTLTAEAHAQLTSTTPASFAEIPPLCYRSQERVRIKLTPSLDGWSTDGSAEVAEGTLVAQARALEFWSPSLGKGLSIPWTMVSLHAISRSAMPPTSSPEPNGNDSQTHPAQEPCLYCQIDEPILGSGGPGFGVGSAAAEGEGDEEEQWGETREFIIVPADASDLEALFDAFSLCAAAYASADDPTAPDFGALDAGEGFMEAGEEGEAELSEAGRAALFRLEGLVDWDSIPIPTLDVKESEADAEEGPVGDEEKDFADRSGG